MALEAVMFDLDGTIIEFKIDYQQIKSDVIEILKKTEYPLELMLEERYVLKLWDSVKQFLKQDDKWSTIAIESLEIEVEKIISEKEKEAALNAQLIPGMLEIIEHLAHLRIELGIVTLNTSQNAILSLETVGLLKYFHNQNWIIGRDKTAKTKPHSEHPEKLLHLMDVDSKNTCLIGDHPTDIVAANSVNCQSIALINPKYDPKEYPTNLYVHRSEIIPKMQNLLDRLTKKE